MTTTVEQRRIALCSAGTRLADDVEEVIPELKARGGHMAKAAVEVSATLADLRNVCRHRPDPSRTNLQTERFCLLISQMAGVVMERLTDAELAISSEPGWEPIMDIDIPVIAVDTTVQGVMNWCLSIQSQAMELSDMARGWNVVSGVTLNA